MEEQNGETAATYSLAFAALDGELGVVAADADRLALVRYERTRADRTDALGASETVFVPLLRLVQVLLGTFNTRNHHYRYFFAPSTLITTTSRVIFAG